MARDMKVTRDKLGDSLEWLLFYEYLEELEMGPRRARVRLGIPPNLYNQIDSERQAYLNIIRKQEAIRALLAEVPNEEDEELDGTQKVINS